MDFMTSHDAIVTITDDEGRIVYPILSVHLVIVALAVAIAIPGIIFSRKLPRQTFQGISPLLTRLGSYFISLWIVLWLIQAVLTLFSIVDDKYLFSPVLNHIRLQTQLILGIAASISMFLVLAFQIAIIDIIGRPFAHEPERLSKWAQRLIYILSSIIMISIAHMVVIELLFYSPLDWEGLFKASGILGHLSAWISLVTASISVAWLVRARENLGNHFKPLAIISALSLIRHFSQALLFTLASVNMGRFIGDFPVLSLVIYAVGPFLTGLTAVVSWNKLLRVFSNYANEDPSSTDGERRPLIERPEANTVGTVENQSVIVTVFYFIGLAFASVYQLFCP